MTAVHTNRTSTAHISVARDFSEFPAGRYLSDGPFSGAKFRDEILAPALAENSVVIIDLDGTEGYGSSFLEEAFGGLVREHHYPSSTLISRLHLVSKEDPSLVDEVTSYIHDTTQH